MMLHVVKQRILDALAPAALFLLLFFSILWICGLQDAIISTFISLEFMRLKTDEFLGSTMVKSTVLYMAIAALSFVGGINVYLCALINFITPFMIIYLFLDEFDPTNQIPYTMALGFFQLIPTNLPGLPVRLGAILGAAIVTYLAVLLTRVIEKKKPNQNIQRLSIEGLGEMALELEAVLERDFAQVQVHQEKLFAINRALSRSIYGANDSLVLNSRNRQLYFPFIIVFQHMNHLMGDFCRRPELLTQDTMLYLEKLRVALKEAVQLAQDKQLNRAAMRLLVLSDEIEIDRVDVNHNIVYILNYLSTAFLDLQSKHRHFSLKNIRLPAYMWYQMRANFSIQSFKMRFALRLSIAVCPAATLVYYFQLPHGFWLPMTILVLILPYRENTLRKIVDRVVGTLCGIGVFAILYYFFPGAKEQLIIMVVVNFFLYTTRRYAFTAIFLTCSSFAINISLAHSTEHLFTLRFVYTIGAALIAIVASYCILPTNHAAELKNMMQRLLEIDLFLIDALEQVCNTDAPLYVQRDLVLTSYLVSGKIETHCAMAKNEKSRSYVKKFILLNNQFVTDFAHIYRLMAMQQKERIDPEALGALAENLRACACSMKEMLSGKRAHLQRPESDYKQVYNDVYINGKMLRSADCLYRMHDCVQTHFLPK
mgnify:CR=1 FL=1